MLILIFEGDVWQLEASYPETLDADGNPIPPPAVAKLMAVYQILDNETGSSPRMLMIVNHAHFPQRAIMVDTRLVFIANVDGVREISRVLRVAPTLPIIAGQLACFSLAHGSRADFDSIDATRLNTGSSDELELPLGQGPRQNSASSMGFKQARNFCYRGSEAAAGPSHGKQLHLNSGLHWE
jgi:hypothetical protein